MALGPRDIPPALATVGGLRTFQTPKIPPAPSPRMDNPVGYYSDHHNAKDKLHFNRWDHRCNTITFCLTSIISFSSSFRAKVCFHQRCCGEGWPELARWDSGLSPLGDPGLVWPLKRQTLCNTPRTSQLTSRSNSRGDTASSFITLLSHLRHTYHKS